MLRRVPVMLLAIAALAPAGAQAIIPDAVPDLPLLGAQVPRGTLVSRDADPVAPTPKVVDGDISDWTGESTLFGGTSILSHGELVYQDHVMDDWGADDGQDATRIEITDQTSAAEARAYRAEALSQAAGEQFGVGGNETVAATAQYGDYAPPAGLANQADISEARIAADADSIFVLVRTTGMTTPDRTAALVYLDTTSGPSDHNAPGVSATGAEWTFVAHGSTVDVYYRGNLCACATATAVTNASGFTNAIEIEIARGPAFGPGNPSIAIATGLWNPAANALHAVRTGAAKSDLINVAFRHDEPQRIWFDRDQSQALLAGTIDRYLQPLDLAALSAGATQTFEARPGYHDRIYVSDSVVNAESESGQYYQGPYQHYGVYLPSAYRPGRTLSATWWTHYRGGHAHDAAAWVPGLLRHFGEDQRNIVITPGARGTSSWYVGRGHEDFLDVWDDAMASFPIDPARVYMTGYSMGGFASWLLPMLYPDRFAGSSPTAGPPTQGLWAGAGPATGSANGGDAEAQLLFNLVENAGNVPYVIYHGTNDELVPYAGVARMAARFTELGYRNRLYTFPGYEHYTNAIIDEWQEAAAYLNRSSRDPNPPHVVYRRVPALELAVETVGTPTPLSYTFDGAYYVDGLQVRNVVTLGSGKPSPASFGTIDVTTFGRGVPQTIGVPEAGTAGQGTAYVMAGLRHVPNGRVAATNRFDATLTNVSAVTLDLARMGLTLVGGLPATITTDGPVTIATVNPSRVLTLGAGTHTVTIS